MIEKVKVARKEKQKKLHGFSLYQNIANFEAFLWNLKLSANHLFWSCDIYESYFECIQIPGNCHTLTTTLENLLNGSILCM